MKHLEGFPVTDEHMFKKKKKERKRKEEEKAQTPECPVLVEYASHASASR